MLRHLLHRAPGVSMISMERRKYYIGGKVEGLSKPVRPFPCPDPSEVRAMLPAGKDVVAFQCRNPIHRAHYELFTRARRRERRRGRRLPRAPHHGSHPGRRHLRPRPLPHLRGARQGGEQPAIRWAYLPYSMHMAGPREAIQHMIIRKNYGCTHFIIGRDMAGSKSSIDGEDFYGAYDAQDLAKANAR